MTDRAASFFRAIASLLAHRRAPLVIIGAGLALRIALFALAVDVPLRNDPKIHSDVARLVVSGAIYSPDWPPGLSYCIAAFYLLFGDAYWTARLSMLVLYAPFILLLYRVVRRAATARAGSIATLVFGFAPTWIFHSLEPLTQLPVALCLLGILELLHDASERMPLWKPAALGALLGAVVLLRPASALLVVFVAVYLLARPKDRTMSRRALSALIAVLVPAAMVYEWMAKAQDMTGHIVPLNYNNARNFFYGNNPYTPLYRTWWFGSHGEGEKDVPAEYSSLVRVVDAKPLHERDAEFRRIAMDHILSRPDLFLLRTANRARCFFAFDTFTGSFMRGWYSWPTAAALAAIAIDAIAYCSIGVAFLLFLFMPGMRGRHGQQFSLIVWLTVLYAVPYFFSFAHPTYHFPIVPLLAIPAAIAAERLLGRIEIWQMGPRDGIEGAGRIATRPFLIAAVVFALIQIEWIVMMAGRL